MAKAKPKAKTAKTYKWEYYARGSSLVCYDNTFHEDGQIQAMCDSPETAQCIAEVMNASRKPETVL